MKSSDKRQARLKADLMLMLAALFWGSAFVAQRIGAQSLGPFLFNASRFAMGALLLLPLVGFRLDLPRREWAWVSLAGALLFSAAALQQAGLKTTTAGNAAFITGLYVVFIPLLLVFFFRQSLSLNTWLAAVLAAAGIFFLSAGEGFRLAGGDALELAGAFFWAWHVIVVGKIIHRIHLVRFAIGQYLACAALNLAAGLWFDLPTLPGFGAALPGILYSGVFSIAVGFTLQAVGQRHTPPSEASLIMSLETVFGALFGIVLLGEAFNARQGLGVGLIVFAILLAQLRPISLRKTNMTSLPEDASFD